MSEELTKTKLLPIQGKDMDSIMQNLETGVAELFTSERYQEYLKTIGRNERRSIGRRSAGNHCICDQ